MRVQPAAGRVRHVRAGMAARRASAADPRTVWGARNRIVIAASSGPGSLARAGARRSSKLALTVSARARSTVARNAAG